MIERDPSTTKEYLDDHITEDGRDEVILGYDFDGTQATLPAYIEIDGIQYHPEHPKAIEHMARGEK